MPNAINIIIMKAFFTFFCVSLVVVGCSNLNKVAGLKDDHQLEEILEDVIEYEYGIEIDLSPDSEE